MVGCRAGKAVTIAQPSGKGHKEEVADLVDNKLLDEHNKVITVTPAISRHELVGEECTFVVLASAALAAALKPQQVVDTVNKALRVGTCFSICRHLSSISLLLMTSNSWSRHDLIQFICLTTSCHHTLEDCTS